MRHLCFNPTVVRLKDAQMFGALITAITRFNPTVVRLKVGVRRRGDLHGSRFNPTVVRLKANP